MIFEDRSEAGRKLAFQILQKYPQLEANRAVIVLALPRGGVPVAFEIAKKLHAPLDLIVTHKLGAPGNKEFAIGAVAEDGSSFIDPESSGYASQDYLKEEIRRQLREIQKRIKKYRGGRTLPKLGGKMVILVDDGIATGNTMKAACSLAKNAKAARIIVAVPVLPADALRSLQKIKVAPLRRGINCLASLRLGLAEVVFLDTPSPFFAIGRFYRNFEQLTDEEVRGYLSAASK